MYLFKVQDRFLVTGRGLILIPGFGEKKVKVNDKIKIVRPDNTLIEATVKGISNNHNHDISVGFCLTKDDVPIGSEIWLIKQ